MARRTFPPLSGDRVCCHTPFHLVPSLEYHYCVLMSNTLRNKTCGGCQKSDLSSWGLSLHVGSSADPRCSAWGKSLPKPFKPPPRRPSHAHHVSPRRSRSPQAGPSNAHDASPDAAPESSDNEMHEEPFNGDFFGEPEDYDGEDFGGWEPEDDLQAREMQDDGVIDEENSDEENDADDMGGQREVLEGDADGGLGGMDAVGDGVDAEAGDVPPIPMDEELVDEYRRFGVGGEDGAGGAEGAWKDPIRECFTKGEAGKIWGHSDSTYDHYRQHLPQDTVGETFCPFNSQLDQEFAHWAKSRGPSATSLDELLAINGVRFSLPFTSVCKSDPYHLCGSSQTSSTCHLRTRKSSIKSSTLNFLSDPSSSVIRSPLTESNMMSTSVTSWNVLRACGEIQSFRRSSQLSPNVSTPIRTRIYAYITR